MGRRGRRRLAVALAVAGIATAVAVPAAGAQTLPWGTGCDSLQPGAQRTSATCGSSLVRGRAIPPAGAPAAVKEVIAAANQINRRPYVWGGGHVSWFSRGYDCSGAVGYALHGADLLGTTMVSGQLQYWGAAGLGNWITVYANSHHVYMVVAGLRFDTRGNEPGVTGPRWHMAGVDPTHFVARHPAGL